MIIERSASTNDVEEIVDIHCSAFQYFFLTSLGKDFLRFYYSCFIKNYKAVVKVSEENGIIVGFSAATEVCKGFNSQLIKSNLLKFAGLSIKMLFTTPKSLIRLAKNLTKKSGEVLYDEDYAELYSIGVKDNHQGKGIGKQLLASTETELKSRGVSKVSLTTDYFDNDATLGFYRSMGYEVLYEFVTYPDRKMYRLIKTI